MYGHTVFIIYYTNTIQINQIKSYLYRASHTCARGYFLDILHTNTVLDKSQTI